MSDVGNNEGMIGKNKTTIQAVVTKQDRDLIQKLARVQDRSESYIAAKIIHDYLHGSENNENK